MRVRVRVSQGYRRLAKGEGKGAREPHQPFFPKGHFSKDLCSFRAARPGRGCGVPSSIGARRSIAVL